MSVLWRTSQFITIPYNTLQTLKMALNLNSFSSQQAVASFQFVSPETNSSFEGSPETIPKVKSVKSLPTLKTMSPASTKSSYKYLMLKLFLYI